MRVMYLSPTGQLGGAESSLVDILASLRRAEPSWPLHLLAASDGPLIARVRSLGVTAEVLPFPPAIAPARRARRDRVGRRRALRRADTSRFAGGASLSRRAGRAIEAFDPAIVHTNGLKMHLLGAWASRPSRRPALVWHLHDYLGGRPTTTRLLRWHHGRPAAVVTNSASVAADAARALANGTRVVTVRNGVDLDRFSIDRRPRESRRDGGTAPGAAEHGASRAGGDAGAVEGPRDIPRGHRPAAGASAGSRLHRRRCRLSDGGQPVFARRAPPARALAGRRRSRGVHRFRSHTGGHFPRASRSSCTRARRPSRSGWSSPRRWPAGAPSSSAMPAARRRSSRQAWTRSFMRRATPADLAAQIAALASDAELRARLGRAARATAERSFDRARLAAELDPHLPHRRDGRRGRRRIATPRSTRREARDRRAERTLVDRCGGGPDSAASGRPISRDELDRRRVTPIHSGRACRPSWARCSSDAIFATGSCARSVYRPVRAAGNGAAAADSPARA